MFYSQLNYLIRNRDDRVRAAKNLVQLRSQLDRTVPPKDSERNLLVATFNVRDLGKRNRRGQGPRLPESWFYLAEVISRFDLVAVQEVNELDEWLKIMKILGPDWDYIATDETDPKLGGNGERMTFAFDRRKVRFQNIAGEIVLPPHMLISGARLEVEGRKVHTGAQFKRTPFIASFQSGWLKFDICTVHLYYGAASGEKLRQRIDEIGTIAEYLSTRADRALGEDRALVLLGDFNIVHPEHKTMKALTDNGFKVPKALRENPTTLTGKYYDQIAFKTAPEVLEYIESRSTNPLKRNAGVVPLFESVYTDNEFPAYRDYIAAKTSAGRRATTTADLKKAYRSWRTFQFSDHYPMWVRLETDSSGAYLNRVING